MVIADAGRRIETTAGGAATDADVPVDTTGATTTADTTTDGEEAVAAPVTVAGAANAHTLEGGTVTVAEPSAVTVGGGVNVDTLTGTVTTDAEPDRETVAAERRDTAGTAATVSD